MTDQKSASPVPTGVSGVQWDDRLLAALSYLGILCLVAIVVGQRRPFVKAHAKQGLVLLILYVIIGLLMGSVLGRVMATVLAVLAIIGIVMALTGKPWKLPLVGDYAASLNL